MPAKRCVSRSYAQIGADGTIDARKLSPLRGARILGITQLPNYLLSYPESPLPFCPVHAFTEMLDCKAIDGVPNYRRLSTINAGRGFIVGNTRYTGP